MKVTKYVIEMLYDAEWLFFMEASNQESAIQLRNVKASESSREYRAVKLITDRIIL